MNVPYFSPYASSMSAVPAYDANYAQTKTTATVETVPAAETAIGSENISQEASNVFTVKQFKQKCDDMSKLAAEVEKLEDTIPVVKKRLGNVGQQLKDLGLKPLEFKADHLNEPLNISDKTSFEEAKNLLENHGKVVKENVTEAFRIEHDSLRAKEREIYAQDNLKHILNNPARHKYIQPQPRYVHKSKHYDICLPSLSTMIALYVLFNRGSFFDAIVTKGALQLIGL